MNERPTAVIVYLSGHLRGTTYRLSGERVHIGSGAEDEIHVLPHELPPGATRSAPGGLLGSLARLGDTYEMVAAPGVEIWVNGQRVERQRLAPEDLIEIGEGGPLLRYRVQEPGAAPYKSMAEALSDCRDRAQRGGDGVFRQAGIFLRGAPFELMTQTSPWFRVRLLVALVLLVAMMGALTWRNLRLEDRLAREQERFDSLSALLEGAEPDSFSMEDVRDARGRLEERLSDTVERLEALESRAGSRERVISLAARSVVFLQGAYGFREEPGGRPLRYVSSDSDTWIAEMPVTLEGDGPEVEILYTGTAFVVSRDGLLLTNRHVALPWNYDENAQRVIEAGLVPVMRRFRGFLPGDPVSFDVTTVGAADGSDLAVLRCAAGTAVVTPLPLNEEAPPLGAEVIVLGYPTGMNALLARADPAYVEQLLGDGELDFWKVAEGLAAGGYVAPLATVGVVGQRTPGSLVYDAQTTHGGSGGPVLDGDGRVVAVNAAVVPEFGGSNMGVPAERAARLLEGIPEDGGRSDPS